MARKRLRLSPETKNELVADGVKYIGGYPHRQVLCWLCKGLVWVQLPTDYRKRRYAPPLLYACRTCTEPKKIGVGRGETPPPEPSEED